MRRERTDYAVADKVGGPVRTQVLRARRVRPAQPACETVDLACLMEAAVQHSSEAARRRGVRVARRAYRPVEVSGDPLVLYAVVEGLVANAIARSNPGAIVVCAVQQQGRTAVASVADDGPDLHGSDLARMLWPHGEVVGRDSTIGGARRLDDGWLGVASQLHGARIEGRNRGESAGAVLSLHMPAVLN